MEQTLSSISPAELYARLGTAAAPTVVDVRRLADFATAGELIVSAYHRDPDEVEQWRRDLPRGRQVVVHCVHGHQVSQGVAAALRAAGADAAMRPSTISRKSCAAPTPRATTSRRSAAASSRSRWACPRTFVGAIS